MSDMREGETLEERQVIALERLADSVIGLQQEIGGLKATIQGLRGKIEEGRSFSS